MIELSVVTLNWNRKDDLKETLTSIWKQDFSNYEIIVVDNGSTDGSVEMVEEEFKNAKTIKLDKNMGIKGYNIGMQYSKGKYVVLIDNDMILVQNDSLGKIGKYFEENTKLGAIAFKIIDADTNKISLNNPKYILNDDGENGFETSVFDGGGVAIRKNILEKMGYYPEEFFMYQTEIDLSTKIWNAGFEIRYFPDVAVIHKWSPKSRNNEKFLYLWHRNYLWYVFKYFPLSLLFTEVIGFIIVGFYRAREKKYIKVWIKATLSAFIGIFKILKMRHVVDEKVLIKMQKIRMEHYKRENKIKKLKPFKKGMYRYLFWIWYNRRWI